MRRLLLTAVALVTVGAGCAAEDAADTGADDGASVTADDGNEDDGETETGDVDDDAETADASDEPDDMAEEADATVALASTELGEVLVDAGGMTLYVFDRDEQGPSVCEDDCEANWPPLVAEEPVAGDGVDEALLGTAARPDGTPQVTYDGWPLYGFVGDQEPGDVTGQAVQEVWWVIDASGVVLRDGAAADASDEEARSSY